MLRSLILSFIILSLAGCSMVDDNASSAAQTTVDKAISMSADSISDDIKGQ